MFFEVLAYYGLMFYVYCFLGWCFESSYVSLCHLSPENRGFVSGPFVIIYGVCAMILISMQNFLLQNILLAYFVGAAVITIIEYATGEVMQIIFGKRYWDYSRQPFNYKGHICLSSSVAWGFMAVLLIKYINPAVESFISMADTTGIIIAAFTASVYFAADYIESFRREYSNVSYKLIHLFG